MGVLLVSLELLQPASTRPHTAHNTTIRDDFRFIGSQCKPSKPVAKRNFF
jgi:hypothetical protein